MGKVEKTRFERYWRTFVNPAFSAAWKSPHKMVAWNQKNSIKRLFFRFPPMGKFNKTRFERDWTTFVNPAFSAAWKSPPKMVAWNRNFKIRSKGCFFVSPRWGNPKAVSSLRPDGESWKNAFWTLLEDLRQPGFFRCLEKPTQNGGMKPKF